jgi:hypothetical protein
LRHLIGPLWSGVCKIQGAQDNRERQHAGLTPGKEDTMDFGIILLISNTLMAIFLYILIKLIWQD